MEQLEATSNTHETAIADNTAAIAAGDADLRLITRVSQQNTTAIAALTTDADRKRSARERKDRGLPSHVMMALAMTGGGAPPGQAPGTFINAGGDGANNNGAFLFHRSQPPNEQVSALLACKSLTPFGSGSAILRQRHTTIVLLGRFAAERTSAGPLATIRTITSTSTTENITHRHIDTKTTTAPSRGDILTHGRVTGDALNSTTQSN
ncbi:hypothetical protein DFH27DRAFT_656715 [Peziza echinospora]|nr:hypothetical protein DFH27DRAFT_656715 [Peziza echinospora]